VDWGDIQKFFNTIPAPCQESLREAGGIKISDA